MTDQPAETRAGRNGQLKVITTTERARELGKKSAAARIARREAERAGNISRSREAGQHLQALMQSFQRADLGPAASAVAQQTLHRIATGEIPIRNGSEAAEILRVTVDIARLEAGQATSQTAHIALSAEQVQARLAALAGRISPGQSPALPAGE